MGNTRNESARDFQANRDAFLERPLPSNTEAERAILGSILLDNNLINQAIENIVPDDFYSPFHRAVFAGMMALFENGQKLDPILIGEELKKVGKLESYGGVAAISNVTYGLPHFDNIFHYLNLVVGKSHLRQMIKACNTIVSEALAEDDEPEIVIDNAEKLVFAVADAKRQKREGFKQLAGLTQDVLAETSEFARARGTGNGAIITGLQTGFRDVDALTGGLQKQDLILFAARPGLGKTSFVLNIAQRASKLSGAVVGFFSLEMSKKQLALRALCTEAMVDSFRMRQGFLARNEWERLADALGVINDTRVFIDDTPGLSTLELSTLR